MELVAIIIGTVGLIVLYFAFGVVLKFLWGWWILLLATPACLVVGFLYGWGGAIGALVAFFISISLNNSWHSNRAYLAVTASLDRAFHFED